MAVRRDQSKGKAKNTENQDFKLTLAALEKGEFAPLYILYGSQTYLRNQYRDRIARTILGDGDQMNLSVFRDDAFDILEVMDLARTLPFFSENRVIILENTGLLRPAKGRKKEEDEKDEKDSEEKPAGQDDSEPGDADKGGKGAETGSAAQLADFLMEMPSSTHIIVAEDQVDMRSKLCRYAEKNGRIACCETPEQDVMISWVRKTFNRKYGLMIAPPVIRSLLERTGDDMNHIYSEMEKIGAFCLGRSEVTIADLDAVCTVVLRDRIFELIDAIIGRRREQAVAIYLEMVAQQTVPAQILALMIRQLNQLLQARELLQKNGFDEAGTAQMLGVQPFVVKKIRRSLQMYPIGAPEAALGACLRTDTDYKSGRIDADAAMELLIVSLTADRENRWNAGAGR